MLTFDDGYCDFSEYAWPILKKYGFNATVFLVSDQIGGFNVWDYHYGERVPLMNISEIQQLISQGVEFGSHTCSHQPLTAISNEEIVTEATRSRRLLQEKLGIPIKSIAYPYGAVDDIVKHFFGACGYTYGVTCDYSFSHFNNDLLMLPRIEIEGTNNLLSFKYKLAG